MLPTRKRWQTDYLFIVPHTKQIYRFDLRVAILAASACLIKTALLSDNKKYF